VYLSRNVKLATLLGVLFLVSGLGEAIASPPSAVSTVRCDQVIDQPVSPSSRYRLLFGVVAVPPSRVRSITRVQGESGPFPYWAKAGVVVRAKSSPVALSVPVAWRSRVAITWGNAGVVPALHILGCPVAPTQWNAYAGGFRLNAPACVPLTVRVGARSTVVRFGVGVACR